MTEHERNLTFVDWSGRICVHTICLQTPLYEWIPALAHSFECNRVKILWNHPEPPSHWTLNQIENHFGVNMQLMVFCEGIPFPSFVLGLTFMSPLHVLS